MNPSHDRDHPADEQDGGGSATGVLTPERQRLLALRMQHKRGAAGAVIERRTEGDAVPASHSQQALWFLDGLLGPSSQYNLTQAVRLSGALDAAAMKRSLDQLIGRHEILRTAFESRDGMPMQRVVPAVSIDLPVIAVSGRTHAEREQALGPLLLAGTTTPFDLSRAPLLRAQLLRLGETEHVLQLVVHHIVSDGWSMGVMARELSMLYTACVAGQTPSLPSLPVQFADYALWQRRRLQGERLATQLSYWRKRLEGLTPLELPTDHRRPAQLGHAGSVQRFAVPAPLVDGLKALARRENATLFMVLLAAFKVLLMRYTGQQDVAVGSPVAGREHPELEGLIGYFVNSIVLRTDLSGDPTFTELVARVRQTALGAFTYQQLPFDQLVAELSPQRDLSRNPLYQVSFTLHNQPATHYSLKGLRSELMPASIDTAKFDLSLSFTEAGGELRGAFEYSTALFEAATIERLAKHFQNLLAGIVCQPTRPVTELPLLGQAERHRILVEWNDTAARYPLDRCLHELFEAQVQRSPAAVAAMCGEQQLGYGELNARANQLARHLRGLGIGPDSIVGLCLERSLDMLVAVVGILKAGAAYLPLDPEYPAERRAFMLHDGAVRVVVAQQSLRDRVSDRGARVLCIDAEWSAIASHADHDLDPVAQPNHLACVIYTSGSTGKPKGVQITHRGLCNHLQWFVGALRVAPPDRFLQHTSISFDASIVELFAPLIAGASVFVLQAGGERDTGCLIQALRTRAITILQMVPSALQALLADPSLQRCDGLRYLVCGGEMLDGELAREVRRRLASVKLGNFYGPTETSIDAAWNELDDQAPDAGNVPIGRPVANARCHILDGRLQPVPIGVFGELCIGGAGLARGYLNRPELTAERFIADPFREGERLYRTGDLARYLPDGNIECLGRIDDQVKLHGLRIELGEIEAAINACPEVERSAVLLREDKYGFKRLVAYVVGSEADADAIGDTLRAQLPEFMVPSTFLWLPALPLLANGKLNRRALPAPEPSSNDAAVVAPRSPIEEALVEIWRDVLGAERIGVHENFFDLGGHSLMATQIVSRARVMFQVDFPLRTLFEAPTVARLAHEIAQLRKMESSGAASTRPPITHVDRSGQLPVSFSQRQMWVLQQLDPDSVAYSMPFAFRVRGDLNRTALAQAFDALVQRHEAFRTTFAMVADEPVQVIGSASRAVLTHTDLLQLLPTEREAELDRLLSAYAKVPFDLSHEPLHRFFLVRIAEQDHAVMVLMHHAICDEWSVEILLQELSQAYAAACRGEAQAPPPLALEYADFAVWQRQTFGQQTLEGQLAFWQAKLEGLAPLSLPTDRGALPQRSDRGSDTSAPISASTIAALRRISARRSVTPFMALLACFQALLARYCAHEDIAVLTPIANRNSVETERLVGVFIGTLVMRTDLSGDPTFDDLFERVRDTALSAYSNQDVPFDRLVERLRASRGPQAFPDIRVLFNLLNSPIELQLEGLECSMLRVDRGAAQFDLSLHIDIDAAQEARLSYSTELFEKDTAERILQNYLALLDQVLADPSRPLSEYSVACDAERNRIGSWNATAADYDRELCVHELLGRQAARSADRVALRHGSQALSYADLDTRSNRLARVLRERAVGRGQNVGLSVERGIDMVVAQLAVLKAGAAYVPLDPAYPADRLAYMADDAQLTLLITESSLAQTAARRLDQRLLLDVAAAHIEARAHGALPKDDALDARPEDPAYVIYTSGSTGKPKGVVVPHRAVVNFLSSMALEPGLSASDRLLAVTTLSFDISVLELLLPLTVGAQAVIASRSQATDGHALRDLLERSDITCMQATPSTWRMLIDAGWRGSPSLKALVGGESLPADLAAQLLARSGELWNMYGPTETTVWSTCWRVERPEHGISIGRPIANTSVWVLDRHRQICPIGVPGEVHIGGDGVTLGYLHRTQLTAERFVADPFNARGRLYRTGDLGRWRHDGMLEHLGRLDSQVKLRGHRIELDEIEINLATHAHVASAIVSVREDQPGDMRLVAYVVPTGDMPSAGELREHLRMHLPEYMVPQRFVRLDSIPLLPNGKRDLKALPVPTDIAHAPEHASSAPHTPTEIAVAAIWMRLIGTAHVSHTDNFFDLGGHSLLAIRATLEMEKSLGMRVNYRRLVVESLAQIASTSTAQHGKAQPAANRDGWLRRLLRFLRPRTS